MKYLFRKTKNYCIFKSIFLNKSTKFIINIVLLNNSYPRRSYRANNCNVTIWTFIFKVFWPHDNTANFHFICHMNRFTIQCRKLRIRDFKRTINIAKRDTVFDLQIPPDKFNTLPLDACIDSVVIIWCRRIGFITLIWICCNSVKRANFISKFICTWCKIVDNDCKNNY